MKVFLVVVMLFMSSQAMALQVNYSVAWDHPGDGVLFVGDCAVGDTVAAEFSTPERTVAGSFVADSGDIISCRVRAERDGLASDYAVAETFVVPEPPVSPSNLQLQIDVTVTMVLTGSLN